MAMQPLHLFFQELSVELRCLPADADELVVVDNAKSHCTRPEPARNGSVAGLPDESEKTASRWTSSKNNVDKNPPSSPRRPRRMTSSSINNNFVEIDDSDTKSESEIYVSPTKPRLTRMISSPKLCSPRSLLSSSTTTTTTTGKSSSGNMYTNNSPVTTISKAYKKTKKDSSQFSAPAIPKRTLSSLGLKPLDWVEEQEEEDDDDTSDPARTTTKTKIRSRRRRDHRNNGTTKTSSSSLRARPNLDNILGEALQISYFG